jgi:hypothetical protein
MSMAVQYQFDKQLFWLGKSRTVAPGVICRREDLVVVVGNHSGTCPMLRLWDPLPTPQDERKTKQCNSDRYGLYDGIN